MSQSVALDVTKTKNPILRNCKTFWPRFSICPILRSASNDGGPRRSRGSHQPGPAQPQLPGHERQTAPTPPASETTTTTAPTATAAATVQTFSRPEQPATTPTR